MTGRADLMTTKFCEPERESCGFSSFLDWFRYRSLSRKRPVAGSLEVGCFDEMEAVVVVWTLCSQFLYALN